MIAFEFFGFGTILYGACDFLPDGSYVRTLWITALYVPLIPLRSERIVFTYKRPRFATFRPSSYKKSSGFAAARVNLYRVLATTRPHLQQVLRVYLFLVALTLEVVALYSNRWDAADPRTGTISAWGFWLLVLTCFVPRFLRSRARKKIAAQKAG